ncbi:hypothetical protein TIFTF001_034445 [Ficus carica]|uniref:Uncharacterized protein n=1 Tax=Ficus carica TaxID=3494 RepID=A0AA88E0G8_FICCA|nr:hypothetical protein TIFTF001_034445 [Ficus carica]
MLVRTPTLHNKNWTLTNVPIQAGEGLQLCTVREQHQGGHSKKVVLADRKLMPYVYAVAGLPRSVGSQNFQLSLPKFQVTTAAQIRHPLAPKTRPPKLEFSTQQCPDGIQLGIGHSQPKQGKYNSAYSIGFVVYTCLNIRYECMLCRDAMIDVSSLAATLDTRWRAWTGGL